MFHEASHPYSTNVVTVTKISVAIYCILFGEAAAEEIGSLDDDHLSASPLPRAPLWSEAPYASAAAMYQEMAFCRCLRVHLRGSTVGRIMIRPYTPPTSVGAYHIRPYTPQKL